LLPIAVAACVRRIYEGKNMSKRIDEFVRLGTEVGLLDGAFARFALTACELAAQGKISVEDAKDVWDNFREARRKAGGRYKPSERSEQQQISKLRQIIKVGEHYGMEGWATLELASKLFVEEFSDEKYKDVRSYSGEYDCMVHIARRVLEAKRSLSEQEVRAHMVNPI
jgi:hypothetical protein